MSTLHCLTVSLAHGAGLGTVWGEQRARTMIADAGFGEVATHDAPGDPINTIYVTTKPRHLSPFTRPAPVHRASAPPVCGWRRPAATVVVP